MLTCLYLSSWSPVEQLHTINSALRCSPLQSTRGFNSCFVVFGREKKADWRAAEAFAALAHLCDFVNGLISEPYPR